MTLAGRTFTIKRSFVDDAEGHRLDAMVHALGKALLVMHAPLYSIVGLDKASRIFLAAKHPKCFISLDGDDHRVE